MAKNKILNADIAIKFYNWGGEAKYHAEPRHLAEIRAPNILPINTAGLIDNRWAYFISPFCKNGDLDDLISKNSYANLQAIDIISQILSGLSHLHSKRFIHRDLKPANIYLADDGNALIGDFGSVKFIPVGSNSIPASAHSLLYRPPESISKGIYGIVGDIYQMGIVLYQLLGGYLPYSSLAWLSAKESDYYSKIVDPIDKTIYADTCLKNKIEKGKVVDIGSLPCWVPASARRIISKSVSLNPSSRQQSTSEFIADLHRIKADMADWRIEGKSLIRYGKISFRIQLGPSLWIEKKKDKEWRCQKSLGNFRDLQTAVDAVNKMSL